jgi:hypothetical protein
VATSPTSAGATFQGAVGIDEFNFAQFRSSFEEVIDIIVLSHSFFFIKKLVLTICKWEKVTCM